MTNFLTRLTELAGADTVAELVAEFGGNTVYLPFNERIKGKIERELYLREKMNPAIQDPHQSSKASEEQVFQVIPTYPDLREIATQALNTAFRFEMDEVMRGAISGSPEHHHEWLARGQRSVEQSLAAKYWIENFSVPAPSHKAQS